MGRLEVKIRSALPLAQVKHLLGGLQHSGTWVIQASMSVWNGLARHCLWSGQQSGYKKSR